MTLPHMYKPVPSVILTLYLILHYLLYLGSKLTANSLSVYAFNTVHATVPERLTTYTPTHRETKRP